MNGEIKKYIYIIGTICIVFLVGSIVLHILPWLVLVGLIAYMIMKIVGFIKAKKEHKGENNFNNNYRTEDNYKSSADDYTTGEIIDVEYQDIDNNKH